MPDDEHCIETGYPIDIFSDILMWWDLSVKITRK